MRASPGILERTGVARESAGVRALARLPETFAARLGLPPVFARIARFLAVGLAGLAVDSSVFSLLFSQGAGVAPARAASLAVATLVTWTLNRHLTFESADRAPGRELAVYAGVALAVQGFNYGLFLALVSFANNTHPLAWLVAAAVVTAALSFTGHSLFTFARRVERHGAGASR
jgi:putative flippase GtrA